MTCWLPLDSNKFNLILYSDYRNLEENRDFYDAMKKKPEVLKKINPILVINTKPAWYIPDWFMKFRLRKVEKKYDVSTCFDNSRKLESKWRLKNCDSKSVLILLDKQNRLRYIHYGKVPRITSYNVCYTKLLRIPCFIRKYRMYSMKPELKFFHQDTMK